MMSRRSSAVEARAVTLRTAPERGGPGWWRPPRQSPAPVSGPACLPRSVFFHRRPRFGQVFVGGTELRPEVVIRELVVNAAIHQDSEIFGASVVVEEHTDRVGMSTPEDRSCAPSAST